MFKRVSRSLISAQILCLISVVSLLAVGLLHLGTGYGDQLPNRSLIMSSSTVNTVTTYQLNFSLTHSEILGAIKLQFCQESPLIGTPCTSPPGINVTGATLTAQSGETGFNVSALGDSHTIILARSISAVTTATNLSYTISGITNPSASETFFARLQTFSSIDTTGPVNDDGGLALVTNDVVNISAVVPPYLYFCMGINITGVDCTTATGDYLNFGEFSSTLPSVASTQMVAATNAPTGYAITMNGTTLTSGNDIIPAISAVDVSRPNTSQFGVNLRANTDPAIGLDPSGSGSGEPTNDYNLPNEYKFASGDVVATSPVPDLPRKYTSSYIANISKGQAPGVYVSTLTYIATAGF